MRGLFDPNGSLMGTLEKLSDIVLCNIMFCVCCLPVLTIGAALTALHTSMQAVVAGTDSEELGDNAEKTFLRTFKAEFVPSTKLWLVTVVMILLLFLYHEAVWSMQGAAGRLYRVTFFILLFLFLLGAQYFFPITARFELPLKGILKNSWLLSIAAIPWSLLALAIAVFAVYISFFLNPNGFRLAVFLWAVCGFGLVAYLTSFCYLKAFEKLGVRLGAEDDDSGEKAEGALFTDEKHRKEDLLVFESSVSTPDWNKRVDPEEERRQREYIRDSKGKKRR
ncbi:MAG: YesL family protein [Lachnospiraceae bacterium]|nr:YesL family protein [Lachnospiraceae bacterium]